MEERPATGESHVHAEQGREGTKRERSGLSSRILVQRGDLPEADLTAIWVEVALGSRPWPHDHPSEQVYVIIVRRGRILVGEEEREVGAGDLVYIPSGSVHGIENASEEVLLTYISAATSTLNAEAAYDTGQLRHKG